MFTTTTKKDVEGECLVLCFYRCPTFFDFVFVCFYHWFRSRREFLMKPTLLPKTFSKSQRWPKQYVTWSYDFLKYTTVSFVFSCFLRVCWATCDGAWKNSQWYSGTMYGVTYIQGMYSVLLVIFGLLISFFKELCPQTALPSCSNCKTFGFHKLWTCFWVVCLGWGISFLEKGGKRLLW